MLLTLLGALAANMVKVTDYCDNDTDTRDRKCIQVHDSPRLKFLKFQQLLRKQPAVAPGSFAQLLPRPSAVNLNDGLGSYRGYRRASSFRHPRWEPYETHNPDRSRIHSDYGSGSGIAAALHRRVRFGVLHHTP